MIVALALTAILLTFVLRQYSQSVLLDDQFERARVAVFERKNLQIHLNQMFTQLLPLDGQRPSLLCDEEGLKLICHNGTDLLPKFSGYIEVRLFVKNSKLWQEQTSLDKSLRRKEVLQDNILAVNFYFADNKGIWHKTWTNRKILPTMVKITFKKPQSINFKLAFFLPSEQNSIIYFDKSS